MTCEVVRSEYKVNLQLLPSYSNWEGGAVCVLGGGEGMGEQHCAALLETRFNKPFTQRRTAIERPRKGVAGTQATGQSELPLTECTNVEDTTESRL